MRYLILKPTAPTDPRALKPQSIFELHARLPPHVECEHEKAAVAFVRELMPNAVALMFPMQIGSGHTVLLGFVDDEDQRRAIDPDREIKFVLFVQPVPQDDGERVQFRRRPGDAFDRKLWKVKPRMPDLPTIESIELRASDLEVPYFGHAAVGHVDGRLVIHVQVGDVQMSLHFDNPEVALVHRKAAVIDADRPPKATVPDGYKMSLLKSSE